MGMAQSKRPPKNKGRRARRKWRKARIRELERQRNEAHRKRAKFALNTDGITLRGNISDWHPAAWVPDEFALDRQSQG